MNIMECFEQKKTILMEGALGERLKREYGLNIDGPLAMAGLVDQEEGRNALRTLWEQYVDIARRYQLPFMAMTPTRRANQERIMASDFNGELLKRNVSFLKEIQRDSGICMFAGGLMGCRGDAYTGEGAMNIEEAQAFHSWQAEQFREAGVDYLYAGIMPVIGEAIGMAQAMEGTNLPYIISFTIQKDGRLIDGTPIDQAIAEIDAHTRRNPLCYMTNCVHPIVVQEALAQPCNSTERVRRRFLGIQANTSLLSYEELDGSAELQYSEPMELAIEIDKLRRENHLRILGGCCGTDNRHMEEIAAQTVQSHTRFCHSKESAPIPNQPIHMGAAAIIRRGQQVLLEHRSDSERWAFIGGGIQMEESLEQCITREIMEETGLIVRSLKLLHVFSDPYRIAAYPDGNICRIITALYEAETKEQPFVCSEESRELRYFDSTELSELPIAETHRDILEYAVKTHIL